MAAVGRPLALFSRQRPFLMTSSALACIITTQLFGSPDKPIEAKQPAHPTHDSSCEVTRHQPVVRKSLLGVSKENREEFHTRDLDNEWSTCH